MLVLFEACTLAGLRPVAKTGVDKFPEWSTAVPCPLAQESVQGMRQKMRRLRVLELWRALTGNGEMIRNEASPSFEDDAVSQVLQF